MFIQIASAMARMHERKNVGKVIICPHKPSETADDVKPAM